MKEQSLHQMMNDMVTRLDAICANDPKKRAHEPLSELEAFIHIDGLLASLNKQYIEAKNHRKELASLYGANDAMAEVALDMEDSAWCAIQTRYLELRDQRELMARAQRLMRGAEEAVEDEAKREKQKEIDKYIYWTKTLEQVKKVNKTPRIFEWIVLLLLFKLPPTSDPPHYHRQAFAAVA